MKKLEQKHYDAINRFIGLDNDDSIAGIGDASKMCENITKNIALAYQEWYEDEVLTWGEIYGIQRSEKYQGMSDDELFNLFIEETYGK